MKRFNISILGFGTVGAGVFKILTDNHDDIAHRDGLDLRISRILVRDFEHEPNLGLADISVFTTDFSDIVSDPDTAIVVECIGGVEPARTYIIQALSAGKTVVTSNKEVISKHWPEFEAAAKKTGAGLYMEATVGGGIPILKTIIDSMQANNIYRIMGIINGTTNYILTNMAESGVSFSEALSQAQKLGYAEANPTADIEGFDATYKLSILSSMSFHAHMPVDVIYREGITKVSAEDIAFGREMGYVLKLVAKNTSISPRCSVTRSSFSRSGKSTGTALKSGCIRRCSPKRIRSRPSEACSMRSLLPDMR